MLRVSVLRAFVLCGLVLQLAACGRSDTERTARGGGFTLIGPLSNPWAAYTPAPAETWSAREQPSPDAGTGAPGDLGNHDPHARLAAMEAWIRARPDSLHELNRMLHDPDPSVRTRTREIWTAALSGGRKSDPE